MLKRLFDLLLSTCLIVLLSPVLVFIAILVKINSKGPVIYKQIRVGKNGKDFNLLKFRSMKVNADKSGLLTVGARDERITSVGYYLRKFKVDEIPQLFNVLYGQMSFVGPRPEVRKYVDLYTSEQLYVLCVKPGITDWASIEYSDENALLGASDDPEKLYVSEIMPHKLEINKKYIDQNNLMTDIQIILKTIVKIVKKIG